jgi:hypothetical protein
MSVETNVAVFQSTVKIAAQDAVAMAPVVSLFNPGVGAAMTALAPVAAQFLVSSSQLIVNFRQDMTPQQMIDALTASKSVNWGAVPDLTPKGS